MLRESFTCQAISVPIPVCCLAYKLQRAQKLRKAEEGLNLLLRTSAISVAKAPSVAWYAYCVLLGLGHIPPVRAKRKSRMQEATRAKQCQQVACCASVLSKNAICCFLLWFFLGITNKLVARCPLPVAGTT